MSAAPPLQHDLCAAAAAVQAGHTRAVRELERSLAAARSAAALHAFVQLDPAPAQAAALSADAAAAAGRSAGPLGGLAVSVKDLFDVAGQVTAAGSLALAEQPPAAADAPAVARLRAAGAALLGRTNMTEFAYSGVGTNPHHGTPANATMASLGLPGRIPGGSSSGAAVSVACGAAWAALGTDTGGSIRIPAALHGLVGFKNTQTLTPGDGLVPLAPSLDTTCAMTRSVRDAIRVHEVLAARSVMLASRPLAALRLGVVTTVMMDSLEPAVAASFSAALHVLARAGARIEEQAVPALAHVSALHLKGGIAAAESWRWHRDLLQSRGASYDPRVRVRIERGADISPREYEALQQARATWIKTLQPVLSPLDAVLSPTVPVLAPALASLDDDDEFFRINALLLRNPSIINQLDGCAITLPCQQPGQAPVGLMLWSLRGRDDALLDLALAVEAALARAHA